MLTFKNMVSKLNTKKININSNSLSHLIKFPSSCFSSEGSQVNFAFHKSDKPKLKIKFGGSSTPFMPQRDIPFFVIKESSRKENKKGVWPTISTGELRYSSWKLNETCRIIRGKYIRTALAMLEASNTKGARIVKKELSTFLEGKDRQAKKKQERFIRHRQAKLEEQEKENKAQEETTTEEIQIDLEKENSENLSSEAETNQGEVVDNTITIQSETETKKELVPVRKDDRPFYRQSILPYEDYRIVEAYVGRKKGHSVPSPRAKGRTDRIYRSISKLYVRIEKVRTQEFCESLAIGKAEPYLAAHIRQLLFMHNASLKTIKNFSFVTTSKGRKYRQMQFSRLVAMLRDKIFKEKGIKLNIDIIRDQLKKHLGRELAFVNPAHLNFLLSYKQLDLKNRKLSEDNNRLLNEMQQSKSTLDKSYASREAQFNINYKKIE